MLSLFIQLVFAVPNLELKDTVHDILSDNFSVKFAFNQTVPKGNISVDRLDNLIKIKIKGVDKSFVKTRKLSDIYFHKLFIKSSKGVLEARLKLDKKYHFSKDINKHKLLKIKGKELKLEVPLNYINKVASVDESEYQKNISKINSLGIKDTVRLGRKVSDSQGVDKNPLLLKTSSPSVVKIATSLVLIISLMLMVFFIIYKFRSKNNLNNKGVGIKVLANHYIGSKKNLMVVQVAEESFLIGVTDNNINLIKSLSLLTEDKSSFTTSVASSMKNTPLSNKTVNKSGIIESDIVNIKDKIAARLKDMKPL